MRQFQFRVGHENFALIHVSLVPDMHGEQKTKPTQTTVHVLRGLGLIADLVRSVVVSFVLVNNSQITIRLQFDYWVPNQYTKPQKTRYRCSVMYPLIKSLEFMMFLPFITCHSFWSRRELYHIFRSG
jgi:hypothetical protein